jgi:hypothetical protein
MPASECGWGQACNPPECHREVTLVGEARGQRNVHNWCISSREFLTGVFDAKLSDVISDCRTVIFPEFTGQVNRVLLV